MNRLTKLLSLAALFSFSIATENTEETIVEKSAIVEESTSNDISTDQDIAPVDVEKIMKVRQIKAEKRVLIIIFQHVFQWHLVQHLKICLLFQKVIRGCKYIFFKVKNLLWNY